MGKSSGGGSQQVVQNNSPWSGQEPFLNMGSNQTWYVDNGQGGTATKTGNIAGLFPRAYDLLQKGGPAYFPGDTLANQSPYQGQAIDLTAQRALGNPITGSADALTADTLQGDYLSPDSNPWLDATFNKGAQQIENRLRTAWGGNDVVPGSSGVNQAALGEALSDFGTQLYGSNYAQERKNQLATLGLAPSVNAAGYADLGQLGAAGEAERGLGQLDINDAIQRYNYEQNLPYLNLQNYGQLIQGNYGGTNTTTQPVYGGGMGALGGAALGGLGAYGLSSAFPATFGALGGPWGIGGAAALGALMGKR